MEINNIEEFNLHVRDEFLKDKPKVCGIDTETTGLNIIKDQPFRIIFGWLTNNFTTKSFIFDPSRELIEAMYELSVQTKYTFAHNTKFDLHMLYNFGVPYPFDKVDNKNHFLADTMILARLVLPVDNEFTSLGLKNLAKKYLRSDAGDDELEVKEELKMINKQRRALLNAMLKPYKWSRKKLNDVEKDTMVDFDDVVPTEVKDIYTNWKSEYGDANYQDIDNEIMNKYATNDVDIMLSLVKKWFPIMTAGKKQLATFIRECKVIVPFWKQERAGFNIDIPYLKESITKVRAYLKTKRDEMTLLFQTNKDKLLETEGCPQVVAKMDTVKAGQHKVLLHMFEAIWEIKLDKVDKKALKTVILYKGKEDISQAQDFAKLITKIRTVEKWLSTYMIGYLKRVMEFGDGKLHTSINQVGAVSGRVSSNLQQFPKSPLLDDEGVELFHPRKIVINEKGSTLYFFDESQQELRIQANWTHYIGHPDINLSRAYIPWEVEEKDWKPTDLHGLTATTAFGEEAINSPDWPKLRNSAKTTNFAALYGVGLKTLQEGVLWGTIPASDIAKLLQGFKDAYPMVGKYQAWVENQIVRDGYVTNLFGRRYYVEDSHRAYKVANYLIQGTAADMLKDITVELHELLKPYRSKMIMEIHDEIIVQISDGEEFLLPEIQKIMEPKFDWSIIPMVNDIEKSTTNWADKEPVELLESYEKERVSQIEDLF